jgi:hypothetical protein
MAGVDHALEEALPSGAFAAPNIAAAFSERTRLPAEAQTGGIRTCRIQGLQIK